MSGAARNNPPRYSRCREAYLRCLPELRALAANQLREVDLEVDDAVCTVLNALPSVRVTRPLLAQLGGVDMKAIDNVESYALAAAYTHFRVTAEATSLAELVQSARDQRAELCDAAAALPARARAAETTPDTPEDLAYDILGRAELARTYLHEVLPYQEDLTNTLDIVIEAELQAEEILACLEAQEERPSREQMLDERTRGFSVFMHAYEQGVRPAMAELFRRKDDVDALALAAAYQSVAEELGPEAVSLLASGRGPYGTN